MKKALMAICFLVLMSTQSWAFDNTATYVQLKAMGGLVKFVYTGATVEKDTSLTTRITTPGPFGDIKEIYFKSLSTDCDVFLSEKDDVLVTDDSTIISMTKINKGFTPELSTLRTFVNRESTQVDEIYVTVEPTADHDHTGTWTLVLTYKIY
jgi:hypothetical protein